MIYAKIPRERCEFKHRSFLKMIFVYWVSAAWEDRNYSCSAPMKPAAILRVSGNLRKSTLLVSLGKKKKRSDSTGPTPTQVTLKVGLSLAASFQTGQVASHNPPHSQHCMCSHAKWDSLFPELLGPCRPLSV